MSDGEIGELGPAPCHHDEMTTQALDGDNVRVRRYTVKDIAKLAGVSTATVSRVVNGSGTVSGKTKTRVLIAISEARYSPNAHAAQLGRENGGIPRKRGIDAINLVREEHHACP